MTENSRTHYPLKRFSFLPNSMPASTFLTPFLSCLFAATMWLSHLKTGLAVMETG